MKAKGFPDYNSQFGGSLLEYGLTIALIFILSAAAISYMSTASGTTLALTAHAVSGRSPVSGLPGGYTDAGGYGSRTDGGTVGGTGFYFEGEHTGAGNGVSGGF